MELLVEALLRVTAVGWGTAALGSIGMMIRFRLPVEVGTSPFLEL